MSRSSFLFALALVGLSTALCPADLILEDYAPQRNDRYYQGADRAFIGDGYNFSGVGKTGNPLTATNTQWATLISPHFALSARHAPASGTVTFYPGNDPTATPVIATVSGQYAIPGMTAGESDLELIQFDGPAHQGVMGVSQYALVEDNEAALLNQQIFVYGQGNRLGTNNIDFFGLQTGIIGAKDTYALYYSYNPTNGNPNEAELNANDSGGPSFVIGQGNQLALVGIHSFVGTDDVTKIDFSGDTYVSHYLPQLRSKIAELDTQFGYNDAILTVRAVPEPGSLVLLGLGGGLLAWKARKRRRAAAVV